MKNEYNLFIISICILLFISLFIMCIVGIKYLLSYIIGSISSFLLFCLIYGGDK